MSWAMMARCVMKMDRRSRPNSLMMILATPTFQCEMRKALEG